MSSKKELEEEAAFRREQRQAKEDERIKRLKALHEEGAHTREMARCLGVNKDTATRYRRLAGLSPPKPVRHLGGGKWVHVGEEE